MQLAENFTTQVGTAECSKSFKKALKHGDIDFGLHCQHIQIIIVGNIKWLHVQIAARKL